MVSTILPAALISGTWVQIYYQVTGMRVKLYLNVAVTFLVPYLAAGLHGKFLDGQGTLGGCEVGRRCNLSMCAFLNR